MGEFLETFNFLSEYNKEERMLCCHSPAHVRVVSLFLNVLVYILEGSLTEGNFAPQAIYESLMKDGRNIVSLGFFKRFQDTMKTKEVYAGRFISKWKEHVKFIMVKMEGVGQGGEIFNEQFNTLYNMLNKTMYLHQLLCCKELKFLYYHSKCWRNEKLFGQIVAHSYMCMEYQVQNLPWSYDLISLGFRKELGEVSSQFRSDRAKEYDMALSQEISQQPLEMLKNKFIYSMFAFTKPDLLYSEQEKESNFDFFANLFKYKQAIRRVLENKCGAEEKEEVKKQMKDMIEKHGKKVKELDQVDGGTMFSKVKEYRSVLNCTIVLALEMCKVLGGLNIESKSGGSDLADLCLQIIEIIFA